jgi:hypothetical protein
LGVQRSHGDYLWKIRGLGRKGKDLATVAKLLAGLCAAQTFRDLSDVGLTNFIFQRAQRDSKVLRSSRHVPPAFLERSNNEVARANVFIAS